MRSAGGLESRYDESAILLQGGGVGGWSYCDCPAGAKGGEYARVHNRRDANASASGDEVSGEYGGVRGGGGGGWRSGA